jgi:hypothetical protein
VITRLTPGVLLPPDHQHEFKILKCSLSRSIFMKAANIECSLSRGIFMKAANIVEKSIFAFFSHENFFDRT